MQAFVPESPRISHRNSLPPVSLEGEDGNSSRRPSYSFNIPQLYPYTLSEDDIWAEEMIANILAVRPSLPSWVRGAVPDLKYLLGSFPLPFVPELNDGRFSPLTPLMNLRLHIHSHFLHSHYVSTKPSFPAVRVLHLSTHPITHRSLS